MFPLVIGSNQLGMKLDQYTEKMENVYQDSLKSLPGGMINYRWNRLIKKLKKLSGRKQNSYLMVWHFWAKKNLGRTGRLPSSAC